MIRSWQRIVALAACTGAALWALPAAGATMSYGQPLDPALREEVHRVDVPGTAAAIVMTSYRPRGHGPFPWIVLSHGTAVSPEANRAIARYRNPNVVRQWVQRGYAVLAPVRRGYGASGGPSLSDSYGGCANADFEGAAEQAAKDLLAAIGWAKTQPDLDAARWLLVGQSAGGFASIYTASKQPAGLAAVLAFAPGRGGDPDKRPGKPCAADRLAALFGKAAPKIRVPVLWFYAENDRFIGPQAQQLYFDAFRRGGGRGELVIVPPFPHRQGHGVMPSQEGTALWTAAVARFLETQSIALPF